MNAGELRKRLEILEFARDGDRFMWLPSAHVYAKVEQQKGRNIFSAAGLAAESVKITIRARHLSRHNALRWDGAHCLITAIGNNKPGYLEITAAVVDLVECVVTRTQTEYNELNRPIVSKASALSFSAVLTEKYRQMHFEQREPMSVLDIRYILVVPKEITLNKGELVTIGGMSYSVCIPHLLDAYKNEYEIGREEE